MDQTLFRTRVKFCGMTRAGDVRLASELGVDAVGFIFTEKSPRYVNPKQARILRSALAPLVDAVAVFRDNSVQEVREVMKWVSPTILQFHGSEDDAFCRSFGLPYVKAIAMADPERKVDAISLAREFPAAVGLMFDSHGGEVLGGNGAKFDWDRIPDNLLAHLILAGGLRPDNVQEAINQLHPWGLDVCSGIEQSPGIKDGDLMHDFMQKVRVADLEHAVKLYPNLLNTNGKTDA